MENEDFYCIISVSKDFNLNLARWEHWIDEERPWIQALLSEVVVVLASKESALKKGLAFLGFFCQNRKSKKVCKTYCAPMLSMHYLACDFLRSNSKLDWSAVKIPKSRNICTEPVKCCISNLLSLEQVHNMYFTKGLSIYATGTLFPFFHPFSLISSQSKLKNFPHQNKMIFC